MKTRLRNKGTVFLMTVFVIALLAAVVMGIAQLNTEEVQIVRNQIYAADALAVAEAGLNDAFAELREDSSWAGPIVDEPFNGGEYDVTVEGSFPDPNIISTGTSSQSFVARIKADITVDSSYPYVIRIDNLRINE